ncbi:MAG TPA: hypothetical protein VMS23_07785, partial [Terrimicrobiaceae bacterium]|nr:hypothetical protein [Terrimicrobiaceae bacterium]
MPRAATSYSHCLGGRFHARVVDQGEVDNQAVVTHSQSARVVAAASNRNQELVLAAKIDGRDHIGDVRAAGNQPWPSINHPVVNLAGLIIPFVLRLDQLSAKFRTESIYCFLSEHGTSFEMKLVNNPNVSQSPPLTTGRYPR